MKAKRAQAKKLKARRKQLEKMIKTGNPIQVNNWNCELYMIDEALTAIDYMADCKDVVSIYDFPTIWS